MVDKWKSMRGFSSLIVVLVLSCLSSGVLYSQGPDRVEKEQISLESIFIDAKEAFVLGKLNMALRKYDQILEKDPANDVAFFEKGRCYSLLDEVVEANKNFDEAIRLNPHNSWYYIMYAEQLESTNQIVEAVSIYQKLANRFGEQPDHLISLAFSQMKIGNWKSAAKNLEAYQSVAGSTELSSMNLFDLYVRMEDHNRAVETIEFYFKAYPEDTKALVRLARYYSLIGKEAESISTYQRIIEIDPDHATAQLFLVEKQSNGEASTLNNLNKFMGNPSMNLDAKIKKLIPFIEKYVMNTDASLKTELELAIQSLVKAHPYAAKAHAIAGDYYGQESPLNKAIFHYSKAIEFDQSNYQIWEQLIHLYKEVFDYPGMTKYAKDALDYFPNKAELHYLLAFAYFKNRQLEKATQSVEEYGIIKSRDIVAQYRTSLLKAQIYSLEGNNEAEALFNEAILLNNQSPAAFIELALHLANSNRLDDAATVLSKSKSSSPRGIAVKAFIEGLKQNYDQADALFLRSLEILKEPEILEWYGDMKLQQGDSKAAIDLWSKASELVKSPSPSLKEKIRTSENP